MCLISEKCEGAKIFLPEWCDRFVVVSLPHLGRRGRVEFCLRGGGDARFDLHYQDRPRVWDFADSCCNPSLVVSVEADTLLVTEVLIN